MAAEAAFGFLSGSLALLADAGHNLSDVLALAMAWGAYLLSKRPGSYGRTYGWKSATIVAALANAVLLLVAIGAIAWEAFGRLGSPQTVSSRTIIVVAAVGVAINTATALLFMAGSKKDLNIKGHSSTWRPMPGWLSGWRRRDSK